MDLIFRLIIFILIIFIIIIVIIDGIQIWVELSGAPIPISHRS